MQLKKLLTIVLLGNILFINDTYAATKCSAIVTRVIDGDTIKVVGCGRSEFTVRLKGVDAMESRNNSKLKKDAKKYKLPESELKEMGKLSTREISRFVSRGTLVQLEIIDQDFYGRSLAYVFVRGQNLGKELLRRGAVVTMIMGVGNKYVFDFRTAELKAKSQKIGVWRHIR